MKKILRSSVLGLMLLMFACTVKKPVQEIAKTPIQKQAIQNINTDNNFSGNIGLP